MSRSTKWVLGCALVIAILGTILYLEFLGPAEVVWRGQIRQGNHLIVQIESYRRTMGRLPSDLSDIGQSASESGPLYYKRCNDTKYILWFGTTLGESMTYDSQSRLWSESGGYCP